MAKERQLTRLDEFTWRVFTDSNHHVNPFRGENFAQSGALKEAQLTADDPFHWGGADLWVSSTPESGDRAGDRTFGGRFFEGPLLRVYGTAFSPTAGAVAAPGPIPYLSSCGRTSTTGNPTQFGDGDEDVLEELNAAYAFGRPRTSTVTPFGDGDEDVLEESNAAHAPGPIRHLNIYGCGRQSNAGGPTQFGVEDEDVYEELAGAYAAGE